MDQVIPAAPGWRVLTWNREHDHAYPQAIVAWRAQYGDGHGALVKLAPLVLGYEQVDVAELPEDAWFVAILAPADEVYDFLESAEQVAQAERAEEEREDERRVMRGKQHPFRKQIVGSDCRDCGLAEGEDVHSIPPATP